MPGLLHPLRIGPVRLPNNLVLSPMAGFSDLPFRILCRRHGAGLVCTEMVPAAAVGRERERPMMRTLVDDEERPTSIQLFGTDPDEVAHAARTLGPECDVLGFNMGCPAHQIRRQGCGAALLDDPDRCVAIVRAIKGASSTPLLVKMRAGNGAHIDVAGFGRRLEEAGADGIIFHARTAAQAYSGRADWTLIRRLKEHVQIPVIANGDVRDGPSAKAALEASGADGIAIGRAALGDPRVFGRIGAYLSTGHESAPPSTGERRQDFLAYLEMAADLGFDKTRLTQQAQRFTRGLRDAVQVRVQLTGPLTATDLRRVFEAMPG